MLSKRDARSHEVEPNRSTSRYHWQSDRAEGFSEVQFVYDKEGRLMGVDYTLSDRPPDRQKAR